MLGHAITTELQLLAAREHAADLAGVFASRRSDSTRDEVVRSRRCPADEAGHHPATVCRCVGCLAPAGHGGCALRPAPGKWLAAGKRLRRYAAIATRRQLGRRERRAVEDVALAHLDLVEPVGDEDLTQDHEARHDHRRSGRVEAADMLSFGERQCHERRELVLDGRRAGAGGRACAPGRMAPRRCPSPRPS